MVFVSCFFCALFGFLLIIYLLLVCAVFSSQDSFNSQVLICYSIVNVERLNEEERKNKKERSISIRSVQV